MRLKGYSLWNHLSILISLVVITAAAGCGFHPLYGEVAPLDDSFISEELSKIKVTLGSSRLDQIVYGNLLDRLTPFGIPDEHYYILSTMLFESKQGVALERDATVSRFNLVLDSEFNLKNIETGKIIFSGNVRAVAAYNVLRSEFANVIAERNARDRAAREVADEIATRISVYFRSITPKVE